MTTQQKYREWLLNTPYIKYTHIAIDSGHSKQVMNYWLHGDHRGSSFNPIPGILAYETLVRKLKSKPANHADFKQLKKYIVLSQLADQFFGCKSSTISVMISRKGIVHYHQNIQTMAAWLLNDLPNVKTRKPKNNQSKKVVYKFKLP